MTKRIILLVLASLVVTLLLTTAALGWTPQQIYDDFAKNGKLTRQYTDAELQAYLDDATLAGYTNPVVKERVDEEVMELLERETFPFTGFQMMIAGIVVVFLVGGGVALRFLSRPRKSSPNS